MPEVTLAINQSHFVENLVSKILKKNVYISEGHIMISSLEEI